MSEDQPKVTIAAPSQGEEPTPAVKVQEPSERLIERYDRQTNVIIGVFIVALVTMIAMTINLMVDASHFNSATYKEYTAKIETHNTLLKAVKQNQETILEIQKTVQELVGEQDNE